MTDQRYPLSWPQGYAHKVVFSNARYELFHELELLGATDVILSTCIPLKNNGEPYANVRVDDHGIAVYFKKGGRPMVFACDKFDRIEDNLWATAKTINSLRGIERWGASDMMERAFTGFQALPSPDNWKDILRDPKTLDEAERTYRELARNAHPDAGGSLDQMQKLNQAISDARAAL